MTSSNQFCSAIDRVSSRRQFVQQLGAGIGGLALSTMLSEDAAMASEARSEPVLRPQFAPTAKRVIVLFMFGGPSHIDTFDDKPVLRKYHGKPLPDELKPRLISFPQKMGALMGSPFPFSRHGESGTAVSSLFPNVATVMDDLCMINSMHCSNPRHGGAVLEWHTGSDTFIRPSMGSWISYGLGSENQNLPSYITICQSSAQGGNNNYGAAFLPAVHQGTAIGSSGKAADARIPYIGDGGTRREFQQRELEMLAWMEKQRRHRSGAVSELDARIRSFELAFRMQMEAPEAQDVSQESKTIQDMYGLNDKATADFGLQCLLARRYSERGVRFVQCNSNGWDSHSKLNQMHSKMAKSVDQPIAALIKDLKQRGQLDETLVIWGGEFGRTPTSESADGRDHNPNGFTMWMAGGGVKAPFVYGKTDELGMYAVEDKVHFHDLHATILHMLGFDHLKLTYRKSGRDFRLTDVHGNVVHDLLA